MIIQSGIKTVVYLSDEKANQLKTRAAERMFIAADVTFRYWLFRIINSLLKNHKIFEQSCFFSFRPYNSSKEEIIINFNSKSTEVDIKSTSGKKEKKGESSDATGTRKRKKTEN